jgi:dTDP-4-amino-4,6-dideoxygalactose transaminase
MLAKDDETYWRAMVSTQHSGMGENPAERASRASRTNCATRSMRRSTPIASPRSTPRCLLGGLRRMEADNDVRRRHLQLLRDGLAPLDSVSVPKLLHEDDLSAVHQVILRFHDDAAGISMGTYMDAIKAEGLFCHDYLDQPLNRAPRLSPEWRGPRVMWTENLKRAKYDPTRVDVPHAEDQIKNHIHLTWNYIDYDSEFIGRMVDVFVKVEENLDALRAYERRQTTAGG